MTPEADLTEQIIAKRVSIVIVTINRAEKLRASLSALGSEHQILVVDNGSTDRSAQLADEFPDVRFIRLPKNFGLTKALNIGLRAADGTYILFLHDDTVITGEAVSKLADFLEERQDAGAVCPLLLDGSSPALQVRALPTPQSPDPPLTPASGATETAAECVSGAAIMFRVSFVRAMRQIDEHYGTYGSIVDLCSQVRRASRKVIVLPVVTATHDALQSPVNRALLEGDRAAGTAVYLGKNYGFMAGMLYRLKAGLRALFTFRFKTVAGAFSGAKIDGA